MNSIAVASKPQTITDRLVAVRARADMFAEFKDEFAAVESAADVPFLLDLVDDLLAMVSDMGADHEAEVSEAYVTLDAVVSMYEA